MLIIGPSGSGKTNALLNVIQKQDNDCPIDKIYLYAKDLSEPKYREDAGIKKLNNLGHSWNIQMLWMMFTIILMITTQEEREKF